MMVKEVKKKVHAAVLDSDSVLRAIKCNADEAICFFLQEAAIEGFGEVLLPHVCFMNMARNHLKTVEGLWLHFKAAWWIHLDHNNIKDMGPPFALPRCIGCLNLGANPIKLSALRALHGTHILRLQVENMVDKDIPEAIAAKELTTALPDTWVINGEYQFQGDVEMDFTLPRQSAHVGRPSYDINTGSQMGPSQSDVRMSQSTGDFNLSFPAVHNTGHDDESVGGASLNTHNSIDPEINRDVSDDRGNAGNALERPPTMSPATSVKISTNASKIDMNGTWQDALTNEREAILLSVIQRLPLNARLRHCARFEVLVEDYLEEARIFNRVHSSHRNVRMGNKMPVVDVTRLLHMSPGVRLDVAVLISSTLAFNVPQFLMEESFTLLMGSAMSLDDIRQMIALPPFMRAGLVHLIRRICERELEEMKILGHTLAKPKQHLELWGAAGLPAPTFIGPSGFNHLRPLKTYLDRGFLVPAGKKPGPLLHYSDLQLETFNSLPFFPTKRFLTGTTASAAFLARHTTLLVTHAPSCPPLTRAQTTLKGQQVYDQLTGLLQVAAMRYEDLNISFMGPDKTGRPVWKGPGAGPRFGDGLPKQGLLTLRWNKEGYDVFAERENDGCDRPWRQHSHGGGDDASMTDESMGSQPITPVNALSVIQSTTGFNSSPPARTPLGAQRPISPSVAPGDMGGHAIENAAGDLPDTDRQRERAFREGYIMPKTPDLTSVGWIERLGAVNLRDGSSPTPAPPEQYGFDNRAVSTAGRFVRATMKLTGGEIGRSNTSTQPLAKMVHGYSDDQDWKSSYILAPVEAVARENATFQQPTWDRRVFAGWEEIERAPALIPRNDLAQTYEIQNKGAMQGTLKKKIRSLTRSLSLPADSTTKGGTAAVKPLQKNVELATPLPLALEPAVGSVVAQPKSAAEREPPSAAPTLTESDVGPALLDDPEGLQLLTEMGSLRAWKGTPQFSREVTHLLDKGQSGAKGSESLRNKQKSRSLQLSKSLDLEGPLGFLGPKDTVVPDKLTWSHLALPRPKINGEGASAAEMTFLTGTGEAEEDEGGDVKQDQEQKQEDETVEGAYETRPEAILNDDEEESLADSIVSGMSGAHKASGEFGVPASQERQGLLPPVGPYQSRSTATEPTLPLTLLVGTQLLASSQGMEGADVSHTGRMLAPSWYPCHDKIVYRLGASNLNSVAMEANVLAASQSACKASLASKPTHVRAEYISKSRNSTEVAASEVRARIEQGKFHGTLRGISPVNYDVRGLRSNEAVAPATKHSLVLHPLKKETAESMVLRKVRQYSKKTREKNQKLLPSPQSGVRSKQVLRGYALEDDMPVHRRQRSMLLAGQPVEFPPEMTAGTSTKAMSVKQATFSFPPGQEPQNFIKPVDDETTAG